jgi:hypothetical protein
MATVWENRHPGTQHFEEVFQFDHLATGRLRDISSKCAELAEFMVSELPDGQELTAGLRSLWEAKNCFVLQAARFDK